MEPAQYCNRIKGGPFEKHYIPGTMHKNKVVVAKLQNRKQMKWAHR